MQQWTLFEEKLEMRITFDLLKKQQATLTKSKIYFQLEIN